MPLDGLAFVHRWSTFVWSLAMLVDCRGSKAAANVHFCKILRVKGNNTDLHFNDNVYKTPLVGSMNPKFVTNEEYEIYTNHQL